MSQGESSEPSVQVHPAPENGAVKEAIKSWLLDKLVIVQECR